jgi:SAM-dependent MidA family methyltransferase
MACPQTPKSKIDLAERFPKNASQAKPSGRRVTKLSLDKKQGNQNALEPAENSIAMGMALVEKIVKLIKQIGPIGVDQFMSICLFDPENGYYINQSAIGANGDFITAPEISQVFGELIGVWIVNHWHEMGQPESFNLIELGPGRGTLMKDILRVLAKYPAICNALNIRMVEASPHFRELQRGAVKGFQTEWFDDVQSALSSDLPFILIANEFLDCLPIKQYNMADSGWREVKVYLDHDENLTFGTSEAVSSVIKPPHQEAPIGAIFEVAPSLPPLIDHVCEALTRCGGAALLIDYGHFGDEYGDSLQALHQHEKVPVLTHLGMADLTAHVDFGVIADCAFAKKILVSGPKTQREFLSELGIDIRAAALCASNPSLRSDIMGRISRLIDPDKMGELFKTIVLSHERSN